MALVVGIDEAGLGPILGPLVVSSVVFRLPEDRTDSCLWDVLSSTCAKKSGRHEHRLVVADSKELYKSRSGMTALERTALVMLGVRGQYPQTFPALVNLLAPNVRDCLAEYPWYAKADFPLPISEGVGDVPFRAGAVRRDCDGQRVVFSDVYSEPLLEGHYNRIVRKTDNKGAVVLGIVLGIVGRIMSGADDDAVCVQVDRLGGRVHYREPLMTSLPGWEMTVIEESSDRSAYRMTRGDQRCRIEFATKGDRKHFPVALASVYSKYVRELFMHAFNEYWSKQVEGLAPTAGYYTDARRWLKEAADGIERLSIDRGMLVRER